MKESGKTSVLEALAKSNYFQKDEAFKYNSTHDYPRKEKKALDKSGADAIAITAVYSLSDKLLAAIEADLGKEVFKQRTISVSHKYSNGRTWNDIEADFTKFVENKTAELKISSKALNDKLFAVKTLAELDSLIAEYKDEGLLKGLEGFKKYFKNDLKWKDNIFHEYIIRVHLLPNLPKFLYYDEYYALPSRISIEKLNDENLTDEELKTAKALFELADIILMKL
jgi:hypothetical protein